MPQTNSREYLMHIEGRMSNCTCGGASWIRIQQDDSGGYVYCAYCSKCRRETEYHSEPEDAAREWKKKQEERKETA